MSKSNNLGKILKITLFLHVFLTAMYAGLHLGSKLYYNPGLDALTAEGFIRAQQSINREFNHSIAFFATVMVFSALPVLWLLWRAKVAKPVLYLFVAAFLCLLTQFITTLVVNVPINNQVAGWNPLNPPAAWESTRAHWNTFNVLRANLAISAFSLQLVGLLKLLKFKTFGSKA